MDREDLGGLQHLNPPHPCLEKGGNEESSYNDAKQHSVMHLFPYSPIHLFTFKKAAFTLAEILITLGIIGVVAAITIPNLITKYQKFVIETGIKEAYSILSQAITTSIRENGEPKTWVLDVNNSAYIAENYILPYLKVIKICGLGNSTLKNEGCFPTIDGQKNNFYTLDGSILNGDGYSPPNFYSVILANGMSLGIRKDHNSTGSNTSEHFITFAVDVNGHKGRNTLGKDIFMFTLATNYKGKYKFVAGNRTDPKLLHIEFTDEELQTNLGIKGVCNPSKKAAQDHLTGAACALIIQRNSWKIPDNYPVKI